jgi:hypothetical protein
MLSGRLQVTIDLNNEALCYSILAVASAHCWRTISPNLNDMSNIKEQSREHALHSLWEHLASARCVGGNTTLMINIFVANILLAILDGIVDTQRTHPKLGINPYVHGGRTILVEWQILDQIFCDKEDLSLPTLSIFATMDLAYSLLGGQEPYFPSSIWKKFVGRQSWWGVLVAGHPFLQIMTILVIGTHCRKEEQQSAVLRALCQPRICLQYSSIEVMQQFLQWTWGKSDHNLDWWESFRSIWWKILFF